MNTNNAEENDLHDTEQEYRMNCINHVCLAIQAKLRWLAWLQNEANILYSGLIAKTLKVGEVMFVSDDYTES